MKTEHNLEGKLLDEEQEIKVEKSHYTIMLEQGREWINQVKEYLGEIDTPLNSKVVSHNYSTSILGTTPAQVIIFKKNIVKYKKRLFLFPFIKITKRREEFDSAVCAYKNSGVTCYDKDYENIALQLANKLNFKRIGAHYRS